MSRPSWADRPVLVLGARGMLGQELVDTVGVRLGDGPTTGVIAWDVDELDIRDGHAVRAALHDLCPSTVVNAAAYTQVDGCETHVEEAMAVNSVGPANLARACEGIGAQLVHFSTDFVFDGRADQPYATDARAHPLSVYGRSKWDGECAIRASGVEHLVIRTSWLFGPRGANFVEAILGKVSSGEPLRVVGDQFGRPTYAVDLAEAVVRLLDAEVRGTLHFANDGQCSWYEFAERIVKGAGLSIGIERIVSAELDLPAPRPAFSVLDLSRYIETTGHTPPAWEDALSRYLSARARRGATGHTPTARRSQEERVR